LITCLFLFILVLAGELRTVEPDEACPEPDDVDSVQDEEIVYEVDPSAPVDPDPKPIG
jgi:hypothetical protein